MLSEKIHIYFVPGLAAGEEIFKNIHFSEEKYQLHFLQWLIPEKRESLVNYATRMAEKVAIPDSVLIGVSFGGVVAQEMKAFLNLRKLIIISSIKSKKEMPARLKIAKRTKAYKILPVSLMASAKDLTRYAIGPKSEKRLQLYNEYLQVKDPHYLSWSIEKMVCWDRANEDKEVIHIHGTKDAIFPPKYINDYIAVEGGTHIMLLTHGKKISRLLRKYIED